MTSNPICVAIDTPDLDHAVALAKALKPHVGWAKVGMEFFYAHGIPGYARVAETGLPIFLDLKLHDIPNTVASAMKALMRIAPRPAIVNLHATGGLDMMKALIPELIVTLGAIPTAPYGTPGTEELPDSVRGYVRCSDAIIMERHGALCLGKDLLDAYKKLGCVSCHGVDPKKSNSPAYPILAGLNHDYLQRQMVGIRDGVRTNGQSKVMVAFVKKADDAAITAIAVWLSQIDRSAQ